ncbi:MAG: DUF5320 domain-containing protein [Bacilli bacterium]
MMPFKDGTGPSNQMCCGQGRRNNCQKEFRNHYNFCINSLNSKEFLEKRKEFLKSELTKVEEELNKM